MAGGIGPFLGRVLFLCACPLVAWLSGVDLNTFVVAISALACLLELVLFSCAGSGKKARHTIRPARFFPLQLCLLYCIQLWLFMLHHSMADAPETLHRDIHGNDFVDHVAASAAVPARPVVLAAPAVPAQAAHTGLLNVVEETGPVHVVQEAQTLGSAPDQPPPIGPEGFVLDATPEMLRWNPKTISVVLPCAEERDFAFKTVKSFFENTPSEVLHEIVVVDDGSNPPLSSTHLQPSVQEKYKVKICRHDDTIGLIGAKKTGGDAASGDIVAFFDCHVAPQRDWYKPFLRLIGENYRRMVVPDITALDIKTWTQQGSGGGMSKCYVTWDGDFKWGGPDDMYMGMLSGGLAGMSKRWWDETGGFDDQMMGWGGENIDQGVRMWVCGGEIVTAPESQVAHMWRVGTRETSARYKHVGDTMKNRARAINAWFGDFTVKLDDFPTFKSRQDSGGPNWFGDMSTFQKVKDRLGGCRPFAWYLRRFKAVYEDGGILPPDMFMMKDENSGKCLQFMGHAGTSGAGREQVKLSSCNEENPRFFWHLGNVNRRTGACCSGLRAWNTEQCFQGVEGKGRAATSICEITGRNEQQHWTLTTDGLLKHRDKCLTTAESDANALKEAPCMSLRSSGRGKWTKQGTKVPIETQLYQKAMTEHPEVFKKLNEDLAAMSHQVRRGPKTCTNNPGTCMTFTYNDGSSRCIDDEGQLTGDTSMCAAVRLVGKTVQRAENGQCLDSWSDMNPETWGFYGCHGFANQQFASEGASRICSTAEPKACFDTKAFGR